MSNDDNNKYCLRDTKTILDAFHVSKFNYNYPLHCVYQAESNQLSVFIINNSNIFLKFFK